MATTSIGDPTQGKISTILSQDVFGIIRTFAAFRLAGKVVKDPTPVESTIVEDVPSQNRSSRLHLETFGKSGIRRLVCVVNRNAQAEFTISSPLKAHEPQTRVLALAGLDVGYENPVFTVLEVGYTECDQDPTREAYGELQKSLVYYELDLGLNHVV
ncbi:pre-mRNA-splicing factor rse1, partial [Peltigera leucophlebia]|nr:pre-mRNA-splicing factor rse1 [Peltigera leucophlebia]